jgi:hypothetical protein
MADQRPTRTQSKRVTLTTNQIGDEVGRKLIKVLLQILEDGKISSDEADALKKWLAKASSISGIQGIAFLREELESALADGELDADEADRLVSSMLRVLPAYIREQVLPRVEEERLDRRKREEQERDAYYKGPSVKQLAFIKRLGGKLPENATRVDASELIDRLLSSRPTVRQCMLLRFWNRMDLMDKGVEAVSTWLDRFYLEDPDRLLAWTQWKVDSGDCGSTNGDDVDKIPIGIGDSYLSKVKQMSRQPLTNQASQAHSVNPVRWVAWSVVGILCIIGIIVVYLVATMR